MTLAEKSKVDLDLRDLFIVIVSLGLAYEESMMTSAFNRLSKNQLFIFPFQKHYEKNVTLTLTRSRSTYDHYLNKLGRPYIPNTTYQSK